MKNIIKFSIIIIALGLFFSSCEKPKEIYRSDIPEEGLYINGTSIFLDTITLKGRLESVQRIRALDKKVVTADSVYQKFMFISGTGDFVVSNQVGTVAKEIGMNGEWQQINDVTWVVPFAEGGAKFTPPAEGFYLFVIDFNYDNAYLIKIDKWYMSGTALQTAPAELSLQSVDKENGTWVGSNIFLKTGSNKLKFNFYSKDTLTLYDSLNLITYLGGAYGKPVMGGAELPTFLKAADTCTFTFNYNFIEQFASSNDMPPIDPRDFVWSLIGAAFYTNNDPTQPATSWNVDFDFAFDPAISDTTNYIYKFVIYGQHFIGGKDFKIRPNHSWSTGLEMGYPHVIITGDAGNFIDDVNDNHNFKVLTNATYDVTFIFDSKNVIKTVNFKKVAK